MIDQSQRHPDQEVQAALKENIRCVYVVHRDVPYEFGEVCGVFSKKEDAEKYIAKGEYSEDEMSIQTWKIDGEL